MPPARAAVPGAEDAYNLVRMPTRPLLAPLDSREPLGARWMHPDVFPVFVGTPEAGTRQRASQGLPAGGQKDARHHGRMAGEFP